MSKQRFEHKHDDTLELTTESKPDTLQRVEIITGAGRRRRFTRDAKARIVLESRAPGFVVSEVARWHGLTPQQLFGWRREPVAVWRDVRPYWCTPPGGRRPAATRQGASAPLRRVGYQRQRCRHRRRGLDRAVASAHRV